jgi:hypothetical protein
MSRAACRRAGEVCGVPDDKSADGETSRSYSSTGNHDYHGYLYGDHAAKAYPTRRAPPARPAQTIWAVVEEELQRGHSRLYPQDHQGLHLPRPALGRRDGMETNMAPAVRRRTERPPDANGKTLDPSPVLLFPSSASEGYVLRPPGVGARRRSRTRRSPPTRTRSPSRSLPLHATRTTCSLWRARSRPAERVRCATPACRTTLAIHGLREYDYRGEGA